MARLAKAEVHRALDLAGFNLKYGGGLDGIISRADAKATTKDLEGAEKGLTAMLFAFTDARDHKAGARVTGADIDKALAYAKDRMVDAYDTNHNGLSKAEIAKMSKTGQLAAQLASQLAAIRAE